MPDIQAFHGVRYDLGHVGSLSDVIAPPYDVIDSALQDALYKKHPANVIRLELNRTEPGDANEDTKYARAAKFFRDWRSEGLLFTEAQPALYLYHQEFEYAGQIFCRRGYMARVRLEPFGEGKIFPHEETHSGPKLDRLKLTRACRANLSQIFGCYPDPDNEVQRVLERKSSQQPPLTATDHLGVTHRLWPVADIETISTVTGLMGGKPVFIADGHHRYETALNYRAELAKQGPLDANHPANFVLMMLVGMDDPGLIVLPTHRLFRGLPEMTSEELRTALGDHFQTRVAGEGSDLADTIWQELETTDDQGTMGFFTQKDERWVVAELTAAGRAQMAAVAPDHCEAWRGLGVSILQRLVLETLLKAQGLPTPKYVHLVSEVIESLDSGEFPLACVVKPATMKHIEAVSSHGERMPAKSTYFYPKLLSGLVFNPLE